MRNTVFQGRLVPSHSAAGMMPNNGTEMLGTRLLANATPHLGDKKGRVVHSANSRASANGPKEALSALSTGAVGSQNGMAYVMPNVQNNKVQNN